MADSEKGAALARSDMSSVSEMTIREDGSRLTPRGKYLRSPMYLSLHPLESAPTSSRCSESSKVAKSLSRENYTSLHETSKSPRMFQLPSIHSSSLPNRGIPKMSADDLSKHNCLKIAKPFTRSQSLSDYWSQLNCSNCTFKYTRPIRGHQCVKCATNRKKVIHSAPVVFTTFEETLLPTHNIFFAGRPPSPKIPKLTVETVESVRSLPARVKSKKSKHGGKRVQFLDLADVETEKNEFTSGSSINERHKKASVLVY